MPLQPEREAQARAQSYLPACSQFSDIRDHLQDSAPSPPEHVTRRQRVIAAHLPCRSCRRIHGIWPRYPEFGQPADRHIRLCKSGTRFGPIERTEGRCDTSRAARESDEQCLAGIRCAKLGFSHVAIPMAARDATAESEE